MRVSGKTASPKLGLLLDQSACRTLDRIPREVSWFLLDCDTWMFTGGRTRAFLNALASENPIAVSGRGMNLMSVDPLDFSYLKTLGHFAEETHALWASDRLAYCGLDDRIYPTTFPMPFTEELLSHVVSRIRVVSDILELPFLVENIASHPRLSGHEARMSEVEFMTQVLEQADCGMCLNLTGFMINALERREDPAEFVKQLPLARLSAIRLSGHDSELGTLVESASTPIGRNLYAVLEALLAILPSPVPLVLARDLKTGIPHAELSRIAGMLKQMAADEPETDAAKEREA